MMKFRIFFIVGLLFEISPRVELREFTSLYDCYCNDYKRDVQESRDGVKRVLDKFPEPTYDIGQTILESYNTQVESLQNLTNSSSTILSTRSVDLLKALSLLSNVDNTPTYLLYQLRRVLPKKTSAYCNIVTNLTEIIGQLDKPVNEVIVVVENSLLTCLKQFERRYAERKQDRCEKIDFKLMVKSARLNANTMAFIAETAVNDIDNLIFADNSFEAIAILTFISNLQVVAVHGTNANIGSVLHSETTNISPFLELCFEALNPLVGDTTKLISSASFDSVDGVKDYLRNFAKTIYSHNASLEELLGPFEGVKITTAEVNENLAKSKGAAQ